MEYIIMDNEKYQPTGVAVYRNENEIRDELKSHFPSYERDDETINNALDEFMSLARIEELTHYPENGYFLNATEYEKARVKK